jgi:hypothetical protein
MVDDGVDVLDGYTPQRTLPGRDYYDPDVFARERERIFRASWVCCSWLPCSSW